MNALVNKGAMTATMTFNLADENDRQTFIAWLKQLKPARPEDQWQIDKTIVAAGGTPEGMPDYTVFQQ